MTIHKWRMLRSPHSHSWLASIHSLHYQAIEVHVLPVKSIIVGEHESLIIDSEW